MIKQYGSFTLNEIFSFFMDCLGDKFTEESWNKNKKKLGINGDSEELFFGDKGIVEKFFGNFQENKIKHIITEVFFKPYYKDFKNFFIKVYPDDNNMAQFYMYGLYDIMNKIQNEFTYSIYEDTYKAILSEGGFKYEVIRNWKEFENTKTLESLRNQYAKIESPILKERFLLHSLVLNIKGAIGNLFKLSLKDKSKMWLDMKNNNISLPTFNPQDTSHKFNDDLNKVLDLINLGIENYKEIEDALKSFSNLHPCSKDFFENWILGNLLILKSDDEFANKDQILDYYKKAFESINFAGPATKLFVEMALAVTIHLDKKLPSDLAKVAAKDANNKKSTDNGVSSIFSSFSKRIYNFSLIMGFNTKTEGNDFSLVFFDDSFYRFFHNKNKKNNFKGVSIPSFDEVNSLKDKFKKANIKTVKELFKITEVSYPPIVGLLFWGEYEAAFELLNKFWEEPGKNGYKIIEQPATNNTTPLIQLLTAYKIVDPTKKQLFKKMIMRLIESYSIGALKLRTNRSAMREPIQEAIHTCDIEIVDAILNKAGMDVDTYKIGLDDQSILEYTLGLQVSVPRFNNGLPHSGESSVKLDRILPSGTTKQQRIQSGIDSLINSEKIHDEMKKNMPEFDFNEYLSVMQIGNSTRQEYLGISDMIIKRSINKKYQDKIDMFHRDTEVINRSIASGKK